MTHLNHFQLHALAANRVLEVLCNNQHHLSVITVIFEVAFAFDTATIHAIRDVSSVYAK